jgi:hypothetical protein
MFHAWRCDSVDVFRLPLCSAPKLPFSHAQTLRHHVVRYSGTGERVCPFLLRGHLIGGSSSVAYGEEGPQTGDSLQFVLATLAEFDSSAHHKVLDHSRYDDLTWCCEGPDASRDMDG